MTCAIHTARMSYSGVDRIDITRKGNHPKWRVFAPSWELLKPVVDLRRSGASVEALQAAWDRYVPEYMQQMRKAYHYEPARFKDLLSRVRITLVCFCRDHEQCHRTLLGRDILPKVAERLGLAAVFNGEVQPEPAQVGLFGGAV